MFSSGFCSLLVELPDKLRAPVTLERLSLAVVSTLSAAPLAVSIPESTTSLAFSPAFLASSLIAFFVLVKNSLPKKALVKSLAVPLIQFQAGLNTFVVK